ncbi:MAG: hypothetical protein ACRDZ3_17020 [Acidimicrobiia bacterium]
MAFDVRRTVRSAVFAPGTARERPITGGRHCAALVSVADGFRAGFGPEPGSALAAARSTPLPFVPWLPPGTGARSGLHRHPHHELLAAASDPARFAHQVGATRDVGGLVGELSVIGEEVCILRAEGDIRYQTASVEIRLDHALRPVPAPLARLIGLGGADLAPGLEAASMATVSEDDPFPAGPLMVVGDAVRTLLGWWSRHPAGEPAGRLVDDPGAPDAGPWRPCDDLGDPTQCRRVVGALGTDGVPLVTGLTSLAGHQLSAGFRALRLEGSRVAATLDDALVVPGLLPMADAPDGGSMVFAASDGWCFRGRRWSPVRVPLALDLHLEEVTLEPARLDELPGLAGLVVTGAQLWERGGDGDGRRHALG